jgi:hypothetical protein
MTSLQILIESVKYLYGEKAHYFDDAVTFGGFEHCRIWGVWATGNHIFLTEDRSMWYELEPSDSCFTQVVEALNQVIGKSMLEGNKKAV